MFRPMLAAKDAVLDELKYPLLASPKLDGVRAIMLDGKLMSRTMKPIPNKILQNHFAPHADMLYRLDGELVVDPHNSDVYRRTVSKVMTHEEGIQGVTWYVFDHAIAGAPFKQRIATALERAQEIGHLVRVKALPHTYVRCPDDVINDHARAIAQGYEGLILRDPHALYKQGRSTLNEQGMIKVKMFSDSEAVVLDVIELMHNDNPQQVSEIGTMKRSSHKENKRPAGTMGALSVRDVETGVEFEIGTGFTDADRAAMWSKPPIGLVVKYKHFAQGIKDKPRFPVFLGYRPAGA